MDPSFPKGPSLRCPLQRDPLDNVDAAGSAVAVGTVDGCGGKRSGGSHGAAAPATYCLAHVVGEAARVVGPQLHFESLWEKENSAAPRFVDRRTMSVRTSFWWKSSKRVDS